MSPGLTNLATRKVVDRSFDTLTSVCIVAIDEVEEAVLSVVDFTLLLEYEKDVVLVDQLVPAEAKLVDDNDIPRLGTGYELVEDKETEFEGSL